MPFSAWMVTILCIGSVAWCTFTYWKREKYLAQTSKKLRAALSKAAHKAAHLEEELRRKAALRESKEEKLRGYLRLLDTLINTIPNPIYFKGQSGAFLGCNNVFANNVLGLTRDRIIGARPQDLPDQIPPDLAATYQRQEMAMAAKGDIHIFEAQVQCADGSIRDFLFSMAPILNQNDQSMDIVTVLSDLTDKNRAAEDRLQNEKLEGVLETAGGICHELNQPLQALSGYLELLAVRTEPGDDLFIYIEKALAQVERMRTITAKLQGITHYESMAYTERTKIIDIHKSSR
jgi:PAS domain S-box-containing protein